MKSTRPAAATPGQADKVKQALNEYARDLQAAEERLLNIINLNADAIIIVDTAGFVRFANPAAEAMVGQGNERLVGEPFGHPVVAGEAAEIDILHQPGPPLVAEMRVVEITWEGEPAYLASLRDITDRKLAEQSLRQVAVELQVRNEELDAFAHTVAHDLQASLGTILGLSSALHEYHPTIEPHELENYLQVLGRSARHMSNIIEELLLLATMRQQDVPVRPLDMAEVLLSVRQRLDYMIREYEAEIVAPATWPTVLTYRPWVEEVWVNYLTNAMKYGGRPPRLELGATVQPDNVVRFWVRDNGPGLTVEQQARLFQPYTRLEPARVKGHGLGLSIVKRIMDKLGGQVGVESEGLPGRGCVFSFSLPAENHQGSRLVN